jgi:hypothetical protein
MHNKYQVYEDLDLAMITELRDRYCIYVLFFGKFPALLIFASLLRPERSFASYMHI